MTDVLDLIQGELKEKDKIVEIKKVGFEEAFKRPEAIPQERRENLKEREFIVITTEKGCSEAHLLGRGMDVKDGKVVITDKIAAARSLRNPASWLRRFVEKYKKLPEEGMEIVTALNQRGFLRIVV